MAAAHLLAAAAGSSSTSFRPPLRLLSSRPSPHLRLNRTGRRPFPMVRAAETDAKDAKEKRKAPDKAPAASGSSFNQLLDIKGAKQESDIWKIRLQLTKPVTWPPLVWGVLCGAAASGNFHWTVEDIAKSIVCMLMSGPCLTGYTQTINDWYDRDIDAINEPYRPIPSGAISENEVAGATWRTATRIVAGVGDLVQRTGDGQAQVGYSVAGRSRGRVTPCTICTVHKETSSAGFLVEPQNQGRRFPDLGLKTGSSGLVIWASKSPRRFLGLGLKTKQATVCRLRQKTDRRMIRRGARAEIWRLASPESKSR